MATDIVFELFAPRNENVQLIGSWNDWQPIPMEMNHQGYWRATVPLEDGTYDYQFEVISKSWFAEGKTLRVADPTALQMTAETREKARITIKDGKEITTVHQWQHDDQPLPSNDELIIYELHVGDFRGGVGDTVGDRKGCFTDVIDKLDYLADLGINCIELMPVNEFPGHHSWGYSQRSIYAVENSYGTPDELCQLIDECHARGIRVIHDAVYNHMEMDAPLTQIDYEYWFYRDNPDFDHLDFGPKFNYEFYDEQHKCFPARDHVMQAMRLWVNTFHIDGIRFDATAALRYFDLLRWFHVKIHGEAAGEHKPFYTIAEHVPQDPTVAGPDGPMDAAWYENYSKQMQCTIAGVPKDGREPFNTGELLRLMDARQDGFAGNGNTIRYIDNHDQDRIMWQIGHFGGTYDDAAFRRYKLGATLLLTSPGIPLIWMGQEFGESAPRSLERQPIDWALLNNERNANLFNHYKHLMAFRKTNPALWSNNFEALLNDAGRGVIAYKRWNDEGNVIVVVANLKDEHAGEVTVPLPNVEDGTWREITWNYDVNASGGVLRDTLGESEAKVYVKQ